MREVASRVLGGTVRMGAPRAPQATPEAGRQTAFSVACGLLEHALNPDRHIAMAPESPGGAHGRAYFTRVGQWIRESF